jgi:hypothetical protein
MAHILKNNKSIIDPMYGTANTTAYLVVDDVALNKARKEVRFDVVVYADKNARLNKLYPFPNIGGTVVVSGADFDTHFPPAANSKIWKQIYDYLSLIDLPGIVAADWKKDPDEEL